jgi:succinate-semialdehyde dehydrogenase/glutarate-semialdehyde dehydrogenase
LKDESVESNYKKVSLRFSQLERCLRSCHGIFLSGRYFVLRAHFNGGNVALLKHAPNVCGVSLLIQQLFEEAGADKGVFNR